ncbi:MAG: arginine N-succinyltransferase [Arenicella sp.]
MAVIRIVTQNDLEGLVALANTVDGYMTTMPNNAAAMQERISQALASVDNTVNMPGSEVYLFVLEEQKQIIGISAVYAAVGIDRPFYSYRVTHLSTVSPDVGVRNEIDILNLVNDFNGCSEMATLFLHQEKRGGGRGVLLSYARLMFMAAHRARFSDRVMAEIRGWTDEEGHSPFWEAVGKQFFKMDMGEADKRSGEEFQFMADLMPKFPIYIDLLPQSAQDVIAQPHNSAKGALKMLQHQGFRYQGQVDIFDAGICVEAWLDDLKLMREVRHLSLQSTTAINTENKEYALVANPSLEQFRVVNTSISYAANWNDAQSIFVAPHILDDLHLSEGEQALVYRL